MAQYVVDIAVDTVITALGAFLQPFVGSTQIIRGQQNLVSPPPGSFVKLTEISQHPIETPSAFNDPANSQVNITGPKQIDIQVDIYGPSAGDQCAAIEGVYRTSYAAGKFPGGIAPLYCSDGHQSPLVTGEQQYQARWTITASLQYNPTVSITVQFASELAVSIMEDLL